MLTPLGPWTHKTIKLWIFLSGRREHSNCEQYFKPDGLQLSSPLQAMADPSRSTTGSQKHVHNQWSL